MKHFKVTKEHLILMKKLNLKFLWNNRNWHENDLFVPEIDPKRPFGNDTAAFSSVLEILYGNNHGKGYSDEMVEHAYTCLAGLPLAMKLALNTGCLDEREYTEEEIMDHALTQYYDYIHGACYIKCRKALDEISEKFQHERPGLVTNILSMCMNLNEIDDPCMQAVTELMDIIKDPGNKIEKDIESAIRIFQKYAKPQKEE